MRRFVGLLVIVACAAAGCEDAPAPVSTEGADEIVRQVLDAVASGNAKAAYDAHFTPELKSRMTLTQWRELASDYQELLGSVQTMSREATLSTHRFEDGSASATMQYRVVWAKRSGGVYVSLFRDAGWKIHKIDYVLPDSGTDTDHDPLRPGLDTPAMSSM